MESDDNIKKAALQITQDMLVAFPTETVYGLGGNALSDRAVAAIYEAKGRPAFNPLITHFLSLDDAREHVELSALAKRLAEKFWPGPLTFILPRKKNSGLSLLLSAGMDTVAIRSPAHPLARALLAETGLPIAAPSANRSGRVSPTEASHVRAEFAHGLTILDGGPCEIGIESTVLDLTASTPAILRPGSVTAEEIQEITGVLGLAGAAMKSPGMLASHYAPDCPLRLNATDVVGDEALLAFGTPLSGTEKVMNLSAAGDLKEAAANLFRMLRALDASGAKAIAVMPVPETGLGLAINDRLRRAAAPK